MYWTTFPSKSNRIEMALRDVDVLEGYTVVPFNLSTAGALQFTNKNVNIQWYVAHTTHKSPNFNF